MEMTDKMDYFEWIKYVQKNSFYEYNGMKIYVFAWTYIDTNKMNIVQYPDKKLQDLSWSDFMKEHSEIILDTKYNLSKNVPLNMYNNSTEDHYDISAYYWIDPIYDQSVRKKSVFTKFDFKKQNISGIIGMGFNVENITLKNEFKYFTYINKSELLIGSLITIIISLVISRLNTVKNSKLKALIFLIISNLFIFIFNNTQGHFSKIQSENEKITAINSSLLNLSFLSTVNLFVLTTLYSSDKDLFVETSVIFSMTVLLLMTATYKSTNQNSLFDLIKVRLTNTFIFNFAVLLNLLIMGNFIFYTFSKSFKSLNH